MRDQASQPPTPARRPNGSVLTVVPVDDVPDARPAGERARPAPSPPLALEVVPILEPDRPVTVEPVDEVEPPAEAVPVPQRRSGLREVLEPFAWLYAAVEWALGIPCLILGLAFLAAIPVVQFLSLGYLLEFSGRIGRTARWRDGLPRAGFGLFLWQHLLRLGSCFVGARQAFRLGVVVGAVWLLLLPLRFVSSMALSAQIIDPDGPIAHWWKIGLTVLTVATALLIVTALYLLIVLSRALAAWWEGDRFHLWDRLRGGGFYTEARDGAWDVLVSLRLPYYFWLGLRGFVGTMVWLVLPISLIALGRLIGQQGSQQAGGIGFLVGFAGAVQLMFVLLQLPFLQARFAAENRFKALFEWHEVVRGFVRTPTAFAIACVATLLFALPLYLFKIEIVPREAAWLPGLVFIVFILPARLLSGWAYARSVRRSSRPWRWYFAGPLIVSGFLVTMPVVAFFVLVVFLSQYTSWNGIWSLYEQHAFLLPVPFVGM
jgi:hypothetical protein